MPLLLLTVLSLMLIGNVLGSPAPAPPQAPGGAPASLPQSVPQAQPVHLQTEISAPMFHGTVQAIDRDTLRVIIRTDFERLVPVAIENCEMLQWLRVGDYVLLDVDAQGAVRVLKKTGSSQTTTPNAPHPSTEVLGRCPEAST